MQEVSTPISAKKKNSASFFWKIFLRFLPVFSFLIIAIRGSDCTRIFSAHTLAHTHTHTHTYTQKYTHLHALVGEEKKIVTFFPCLPIIKGNLYCAPI